MPVEMSNSEARYFKLPSIGMYSKVLQNKIEKLCKRFCKNAKVKRVFTSNKVRQKFTFTFINLFVLAVMLVILVKRIDISQPGLIKSHICTNT